MTDQQITQTHWKQVIILTFHKLLFLPLPKRRAAKFCRVRIWSPVFLRRPRLLFLRVADSLLAVRFQPDATNENRDPVDDSTDRRSISTSSLVLPNFKWSHNWRFSQLSVTSSQMFFSSSPLFFSICWTIFLADVLFILTFICWSTLLADVVLILTFVFCHLLIDLASRCSTNSFYFSPSVGWFC